MGMTDHADQNVDPRASRPHTEEHVAIEAPRLELNDLLDLLVPAPARWSASWKRRQAATSLREKLLEAGFDVPSSISRRDARALLDVVRQRRSMGLCSVVRAKRLRALGLRDDLSERDAVAILTAVEENRGRVPDWIRLDPDLAASSAGSDRDAADSA